MNPTEKQLVQAACQGSLEAFGQLAKTHQSRIFALALRMTGDQQTAEDLTQETFLQAFQKLHTYRGDARFYTWLYRIAVHLCYRHLEREKRLTFAKWPPIPAEDQETTSDHALNQEELVLREEVKLGCLTGLVRCLPKEQRVAFVLAVLLDLPNRQVAVILDCSLGAVKARLARARRKLADFLERRCQWIDRNNRCRCHKYIQQAMDQGLISARPDEPVQPQDIEPVIQELDVLKRVLHLYRTLPQPTSSENLIERIRKGLVRGEWRVLT